MIFPPHQILGFSFSSAPLKNLSSTENGLIVHRIFFSGCDFDWVTTWSGDTLLSELALLSEESHVTKQSFAISDSFSYGSIGSTNNGGSIDLKFGSTKNFMLLA